MSHGPLFCQAEPAGRFKFVAPDVTPISTLFGHAVAAHRAGRVASAISAYRTILLAEPGHARARHLLGFALLQTGDAPQAEVELTEAVRRSPGLADAWAHLGLARLALDRSTAADGALRRALALEPAQQDATDGRLQATRSAGPRQRIRTAVRAVTLAPQRAIGWHSLGLAFASHPAGAAAPAETCLRRAMALDPGSGPVTTDLADMVRRRRAPGAAFRIGQWARRLQPLSPSARVVCAAAAFDLDRVAAAQQQSRIAALLVPATAGAYGNRAQCAYRSARFEDAAIDGRRAAVAAPGDAQILANLATYRLAVGDLSEGWPLFRHRPGRRAIVRAGHRPASAWTGEPVERLLVLAEQGLGDELLFASCWPDLARAVRSGRLATVQVEIDARLRSMAARSYPELQWLDRDGTSGKPRPATDAAAPWIAAGDLPSLLRRTLEDFPAGPGYLEPDSERAAAHRHWLELVAPGRRRIGLCWRSGLRTGDRIKHYPALTDCRPLLASADVCLIVLQYDDCADEIAAAARPGDAPILFPPGLDRRNDLDGVAALIAALDVTIAAETAVLALAGAVGAPAIGFGLTPGWTNLGRERSPWHPSTTGLYRRPDERWPDFMQRVRDAAVRHR